jgi:hypothetical protein
MATHAAGCRVRAARQQRHTMHDEPRDTPEIDSDISDVVTGPIGSASLVEPTKTQTPSADLDALPEVEAGDDASADTPPTPG